MTKQEIEKEIKALRKQLYKLSVECKQREDRLISLMEVLSSFMTTFTEEQEAAIMAAISFCDERERD